MTDYLEAIRHANSAARVFAPEMIGKIHLCNIYEAVKTLGVETVAEELTYARDLAREIFKRVDAAHKAFVEAHATAIKESAS
jgi:hypothetical protein